MNFFLSVLHIFSLIWSLVINYLPNGSCKDSFPLSSPSFPKKTLNVQSNNTPSFRGFASCGFFSLESEKISLTDKLCITFVLKKKCFFLSRIHIMKNAKVFFFSKNYPNITIYMYLCTVVSLYLTTYVFANFNQINGINKTTDESYDFLLLQWHILALQNILWFWKSWIFWWFGTQTQFFVTFLREWQIFLNILFSFLNEIGNR